MHSVHVAYNAFTLQEPLRVVLGERRVWQGCGVKRKCVTEQDCVMYIPILETIQCLLKNDAVLSEVCENLYELLFTYYLQIENGHQSVSVLNDYCDGEAFKSHGIFGSDRKALQLFLYFDELETCNPLGSKVKIHKLGLGYFIHAISNIIFSKYRCFLLFSWKHLSQVSISFIKYSTCGIGEVRSHQYLWIGQRFETNC